MRANGKSKGGVIPVDEPNIKVISHLSPNDAFAKYCIKDRGRIGKLTRALIAGHAPEELVGKWDIPRDVVYVMAGLVDFYVTARQGSDLGAPNRNSSAMQFYDAQRNGIEEDCDTTTTAKISSDTQSNATALRGSGALSNASDRDGIDRGSAGISNDSGGVALPYTAMVTRRETMRELILSGISVSRISKRLNIPRTTVIMEANKIKEEEQNHGNGSH